MVKKMANLNYIFIYLVYLIYSDSYSADME